MLLAASPKKKGFPDMSHRYLLIPEPILMKDPDGLILFAQPGKDDLFCSFHEFVVARTIDPAFVSDTPRDPGTVHWTFELIVSAEEIRGATRGLLPGEQVMFREEDWRRLLRSVELGTTYHPIAAVCLLPFMRCIMGAAPRPER